MTEELRTNLKTLSTCVKRAAEDTVMHHDGIEHAGYLAFMGLLSMFPFLVFVVALLGAIGPETEAAGFLTSLFRQLPHDVEQALEPRIAEITSGPPQGLLTIAIIGAIWTASSAIEGLRTILNRAYRVHTPPHYIMRRLLSIVHMLLLAFVLIGGMLLMIILPALINYITTFWHLPAFNTDEAVWFGRVLTLLFPVLLLGVVSWIYYAVPNLKQRGASVFPGALVVMMLWLIAAQAFTFYLAHFNQTLIYGSLGGIIAALIFFYICNVILIFGAEFNYHLSVELGLSHVEREPTDGTD